MSRCCGVAAGDGGPGLRGAFAAATCRRALETMLLITPITNRATQTRVPTSRIAAAYLVAGPVSGGGCCCESVAASVEAPIEERISVSA
jgi:hypothetical protein